MTEEKKVDNSTDQVVSDKVKSDTDSIESNVQDTKDTDDKESNKTPSKAEEKKKKKKAQKPKPDIRVQQIGHRRKTTHQLADRGRKIEVIGHVIGDKMDKTITVEIYRRVRHPRVGKYIKKSTKFKAHDEKNTARVGDQVLIHATRALSKTKYWKLSKIIKSGERL